MKKLFYFLALSCAFNLFCAVYADAQLKVVNKGPSGALGMYNTPGSITAVFDRPVVALGDTTQHGSSACPFVINPKTEGVCRWMGTQTAIFTPDKPFKTATRYNVSIKPGLRSDTDGSTLKQEVAWYFETQRPQVINTRPYNNERWLALDPRVAVVFNIPVNLKEINKFITFRQQDKNIPFSAEIIPQRWYEEMFRYKEFPAENIILITPEAWLELGKAYTVTLKRGIMPQEGILAQADDYNLNFHTIEKFAFTGPSEQTCLPSTPALLFTNPVEAGEIYKNISFNPAINMPAGGEEGNSSGWQTKRPQGLSGPEYIYQMPLGAIKFKPSQTYEVTLSGDLKDIFGNELGKDITFSWSNDGYCPSIDFKGGFGILESYLKPYHPLRAVNAGEITVQKKAIKYQDFIPFHNKETSHCKKRVLEGSFIEKAFTPNVQRDVPAQSFVDLAPALGAAKGGIVFTQLLNKFYGRDGCWMQAIDNITNMGLTLKTSPDDILVWASYLKDGAPAKNKEVELRDSQNNILWQGKTDGNGIAKAPGWGKLDFYKANDWQPAEVWAFVKDGDNIAVISNRWNEGIEPWRFNVNYDWQASPKKYKNFIFTERGIYRPGETVFIKSILRAFKDGVLTMPDINEAELSITDPRGKELVNKKIPLDEKTGAFSFEYQINESAPTGDWAISVKAGGLSFHNYFRAEAVKPAEFKVNLNSPEEIYYPRQQAVFNLDAQYMFGAPLAGAAVRWDAQSAFNHFAPKGFGDYSFSPAAQWEEGKKLASSSGVLDDKGAASLNIEIPALAYSAALYVQTGVLSPQNQELFARRSVTVLPSRILLGVKSDNNMSEVNKPVSASFVSVNAQGELLDKVPVTITITRRDYLSARKTGVGGRLEWVSEERLDKITTLSVNTTQGKGKFEFTPSQPGSYYADLSATDSNGDSVTTRHFFYVTSPRDASFWRQSDDDILQLVADKTNYAPGDKAKILVKSPYAKARALVTVERNGILYSKTETVKGGSSYITIPVEDSFAPNVFVSVILLQGRSKEVAYSKSGEDLGKPQAKFGYAALKVSPKANIIQTAVYTDRTRYRPGENVTVTVKTQDFKGKVMPADITVFAVDESVLALTNFKTPDIFGYFYGESPLTVSTADSRLYVIGQRSFGQKGENRGGGGGDDSRLGGADLRSNFKFTAFYAASTNTGMGGTAEFNFKLPDNLTKFRIMAVAAAVKEFGSGESVIEVSKPVVIKPALPRFARAGDTFNCGFVVFNHTAQDGLELQLNSRVSGGVEFIKPAPAKVVLDAGRSSVINAVCRVKDTTPAEFRFSASSSKGNDGLQVTMPVLEVEQLEFLRVASSTETEAREKVLKPLNIAPAKDNALDIAFASTAMLDVKGALEFLTQYPFNCLEQRLSRLSAFTGGEDFIVAFNLGDTKVLREEARKIIADVGLYQTPSGAFAYWPFASYGDPFVTAYALDILNTAAKAGFEIDANITAAAAKWLNSWLSGQGGTTAYKYSLREDETTRAYAVYALSLVPNFNAASYFNNMYAALNANSSLQARIYLLKAATNLKLARQQEVLAESITSRAKYTNTTAYFSEPGGNRWVFASDIYLTSTALEALLNSGAAFESADKTAAWLSGSLNRQGHWGNTKNNAAALSAMSAYYKAREAQTPDFKAVFSIDANKIFEAIFKGRSAAVKNYTVPFEILFKDRNDAMLEMEKQGDGRLYYNIALKYFPADFKKPVNAGFSVEKEIAPLYPALGAFAAGHRAVVNIKIVATEDRTFAVLEDFLPAGFDIVDSTLATEGSFDEEQLATQQGGSQPFNSRMERYDDRLVAFADFLPKGVHTFSYIISATNGGSYSVPSARVSLMYEPEVFGRTASGQITVK